MITDLNKEEECFKWKPICTAESVWKNFKTLSVVRICIEIGRHGPVSK